MRPLVAAVAATAALSLHPASAAAPGAGTATTYATGFFRPNIGIVAVGNCTYAVTSLRGTAASVGVVGGEATLSIHCSLRNASGSQILSAYGSGRNTATATTTVLGGQVPVTICATVTATSAQAGVPTATGTACAPVLPGNVVIS